MQIKKLFPVNEYILAGILPGLLNKANLLRNTQGRSDSKRRQIEKRRETHRGESSVKKEGEMGVMWP